LSFLIYFLFQQLRFQLFDMVRMSFKSTMLQPQCLHIKQQELAYLRVGYSVTLQTEIVKQILHGACDHGLR
jgi:hypothetical protein